MAPMALILLFLTGRWIWPSSHQWLWIALMGSFSMLGQFCFNKSVLNTDLSSLMPLNFLRLIWMSLIGLTIFGEDIRFNVLIGGGIILASTTYITWREKQIKDQTSKES